MLEVGHVRLKNRKNMLLKVPAPPICTFQLCCRLSLYACGVLSTCILSSKNLLIYSRCLQNVSDCCLGGIVWYLFGYALAFGPSNNSFVGGDWTYLTGCANYAHWFFQWTFASTAVTIISGAIAERCKISAYLLLAALMVGWIYPVVAYWVWSGYGWLDASVIGGAGLLDFAGSGVVHLTGGTAALMGAALIGPRTGRFAENHVWALKTYSHALTTLGTFMLWFCWCVSTSSGLPTQCC